MQKIVNSRKSNALPYLCWFNSLGDGLCLFYVQIRLILSLLNRTYAFRTKIRNSHNNKNNNITYFYFHQL